MQYIIFQNNAILYIDVYRYIYSPNERKHSAKFVHFSMRHLLIFQNLYISRQELKDIKNIEHQKGVSFIFMQIFLN